MRGNALLSTFDNQPSLLDTGSQHRFEASLEQATVMLARIDAANDNPVMADDFWFSPDDWRSAYRPYTVKDGILLIPVKGVLLHDFGYQFGSWATGYTYITRALRRGLADGDVKGIAFIVDSPGGHVAGNFELVDEIFAARGQKPMRGYAAESAYSAAYSIISAVDPGRITVTRTGGAGSIGVLTMHLDVSVAMEMGGYKVTFIHAGKHKVDGNSYEALPKDVKDRIQARIDELMTVFVSTVARNRGLVELVIRDFEALTFTATQATSNGLADTIGSLDDAIAVFAADLSSDEDTTMMTTEEKAAAQAALTAAADAARAEGVTAGKTEGLAQGKKDGLAEGATAERTRIHAIRDSEEGKKRPIAALAAALDSSMTVEESSKFLAKLPEEKAPVVAAATPAPVVDPKAKGGAFAAAMANGAPELGAPDAGGEGAETVSRADRTFALAGRSPKKAA